MTSLYHATLRNKVVETETPKKKKVKRWFYLDIRKCLDATVDREDAVVGLPETRVTRPEPGRADVLDLSSPEKEFATLMFPLTQVFDWVDWHDGFSEHWRGNKEVLAQFREFREQVLENFKSYHVPVITLDRATSKEAVCVVFEKVNTGGKALDAFELVTAMYAAGATSCAKTGLAMASPRGDTVALKRPCGPQHGSGIFGGVSNTDFLQVLSLFHTREVVDEAEGRGKVGKELPQVTGNRQALLESTALGLQAV